MSNAASPRRFSEIALATGLASLVCVILHLVTDLGWFVLGPGLVFGVLGVVFGIIALRKKQPKGMAVTGIVTGAVGLAFIAFSFLFALLFLGVLTGEVM